MAGKSTTTTWTGINSLADLRDIVEETKGWGGESVVTLKESRSHSPVDHDPATIVVSRRDR